MSLLTSLVTSTPDLPGSSPRRQEAPASVQRGAGHGGTAGRRGSSRAGGVGIDMARRPALCDDVDAITADWMQQALAAGGASDFPAIEDLAVEDLGSATNAFGRLLRCHLTTAGAPGAAPASVIVKLPTANPTAFRFARWLSMHERECLFYRRLAPLARIRSPALLYGDFDEDTHRFVLVLEDLRGLGLEVPAGLAGVEAGRARRAVREVAGLHGQFWGAVDHPTLSGCTDVLGPKYARFLQIAFLVCLPVVLERFGDCFPAWTRRLVEALGPRIGAHFAAVAAGPRTFVHGDYRGENMFFRAAAAGAGSVARTGAGAGVGFAVVDWQGCGLGAGLYDVAYFLGANVATAERRRIEREALGEYHDTVCRLGARNFTFDDCWRAYRQNMLGVLVPLVLGAGGLDLEDRRLRDLVKSGLGRTLAAVEDLDAGEFLPARGGLLTADNALSTLSSGAYRMYKLVRRLRAAAGNHG